MLRGLYQFFAPSVLADNLSLYLGAAFHGSLGKKREDKGEVTYDLPDADVLVVLLLVQPLVLMYPVLCVDYAVHEVAG